MKNVYRIIFLLFCTLMVGFSYAQEILQGNGSPEAATGMRSNGKLYVVVAVVVTILLGLFIYLVNLDRKISRIEKETRETK